MDEAKVLYESRDHVARITLNRPDVLNAFDEEMAEQLDAAVERARDDDGVWAVVLSGAGRSFCAGQDLRFSESKPPGERASATAAIERRGAPRMERLQPLPARQAADRRAPGEHRGRRPWPRPGL